MTGNRCVWVGRDETGRPYCEHGPAFKSGPAWSCRAKAIARQYRWRATEKGIEWRRREARQENARSSKQLYNLTRPPRIV